MEEKTMTSRHKARGFTMIELALVIAIVLIISAMALFNIIPAMQQAKAEAALQTTVGQLRSARDLAIGQRRKYRLTFTAPRTITLNLWVIDPVTRIGSFQFVSSIDLPRETQFLALSGLPTGGNTPDALQPTSGSAIDFDLDHGGRGTEVYFQPDGRALDSLGRLNNGLVYVARPGELLSSRAVSVLGATGRVKGWRLIQSGSTVAWSE